MVAQGSPVTIWCQGSPLADVYRLYKERSSVYWDVYAPQGSRNKARFHFASSSSSAAGQYQCAYHTRHGWSVTSDPLPLVVTGKRVGQVPLGPSHRGSLLTGRGAGCGLRRPCPPSSHPGSLGWRSPFNTAPRPQECTRHPSCLPSPALWWPQEATCPSRAVHRMQGARCTC